MKVRDALREERPTAVCLLNYRKDRTPFWNAFYLAPVRGQSGNVEYYLGIQADVTREMSSGGGAAPGAAVEGVEEVVARERLQAAHIAECILSHEAQLALIKPRTCGADNSVSTSLMAHLCKIGDAFVLADPHLPNCPMVFCSPAFMRLTGYQCSELVGRNCRLLQGPGTDPEAVEKIREGLREQRPVTVTLLNYKKGGQPFYNTVHISPIRDAQGVVQFYCGVQLDVAAAEKAAAAASTGGAANVQLNHRPDPCAEDPPKPSEMQLLMQKGVVGAVRVAARSLSGRGLRRALSDQRDPQKEVVPQ
jgi:PAS domain S-box-containing protein